MAEYVDEALMEHALKQSAITDIIKKRMYHIKAPQDAIRPYVVLNQIAPSGDSEEFGEARMGQPLFQWTCVSQGDIDKTPSDAFLVAHAIMDTFANLQGTIEDVVIKISWAWGPRELLSDATEDIMCIVENEVHYEEP